MAYDKTNRGVPFRNTDKEDPKHADYSGNINVDSKNGMKFMSLSIKPKRAPAKSDASINYDDQIPF